MKKIYILRKGSELGPFSLVEVFAGLTNRTFSPDNQARREGEAEWSRLEEVIKNGSSLFSVEQIQQMKDEELPAPVEIPELRPLRPIQNDEKPKQTHGISALAACAVLLLMIEGIVALRHRGADSPEVSANTVSQTPSDMVATHAVAQPRPSSDSVAIQVSTPAIVQPQPKAASAQVFPTPRVAQSSAIAETRSVSITPIPATTNPSINSQTVVASINSATPVSSPFVSLQIPQQVAVSSPKPAAISKNTPTVQPSPEPSVARTVPPTTTPLPIATAIISQQPTPIPLGQKVFAADFFKIESIQWVKKEPKSKIGVWHIEKSKTKSVSEFRQCLEVKVSARENTRADQVFAKAYFFDARNKQIGSLDKPSPSGKPLGKLFSMPVLFYKDKPDSFFFEIPKEADGGNWKAVIVFGDKYEAHASCFPVGGSDMGMNYPEKQLVHDPKQRIARKPAMDPLIQYEVKTKNPRQPKITLFLRPPKGVSSADDVNGVLSLCILAGGIDDIKRALQKEEMDGDYSGLLGFANTHKLAILAWGSAGLWNPGANYDDLPKDKAQAMDKSFDQVADAWERGVHELGEKYGIPEKNFLLWGACGSAQWAHRLCLRKPEYFLAIDIHIPGSFDKPTPEAAKVLWCLTTGECYGGYERSLRFVTACKKLGYPMVYKAIVGLGHSGHPDATAMGFRFFEFALTQQVLRDEYDKRMANNFERAKLMHDPPQPWPDSFRKPPYFGDIVNQEIFPSDKGAMVPDGFRVPLPTKEIADIWGRSR